MNKDFSERLVDKRESFRVQLRKQSKKQMLRQKRTLFQQMSESSAQDIIRFGQHSFEKELSLCEQIQKVVATEQLVILLGQLAFNKALNQKTIELLLSVAQKTIRFEQKQAEQQVIELILKIVFCYTSLSDKQMQPALPILCQFLKHQPFFPLLLNLSLIKDWGSGEGNSNKLKKDSVNLFISVVDQREMMTPNDVTIMQNFLLSGDILQTMYWRFVNAINRSFCMDINQQKYTAEEVLVSIFRSLKLVAMGGSAHCSNIINCRYIGQKIEWLLQNCVSLQVLTMLMELFTALMINENTVMKLFSHPTHLINMAHLMNKTNQKLRVSVSFTLSNVAAFEEGVNFVTNFGIDNKIAEHFEAASDIVRKNIGYFFVNLLRMLDDQTRTARLADQMSFQQELISTILKDSYDPTWVDVELIACTFALLKKTMEDTQWLTTRILQRNNNAAYVEALSIGKNEQVSKLAYEFLNLYSSYKKMEAD